MNITTLNKITVKKVFGSIPTVSKNVVDVDGSKKAINILEAETALMRVYGQATGYRVATSQYGDSAVFKGIFKAINAATGEIFSSGECCLPKMLESQLSGILDSAEGAEFSFDISVIPAKNAYGYEFKVKTLIETNDAPIITALEEKMKMLTVRIPAVSDNSKLTSLKVTASKSKKKK